MRKEKKQSTHERHEAMSRADFEGTIAAIATPLGEGGIGVIRLSGKAALRIAKQIFNTNGAGEIKSHRAYHGWVQEAGGDILDEAVLTFMKGPKSYTGEDVVEISCHGGVGILSATLEEALKAGAKLAEKGEFTKRAFLNGKVDLAQAEAVIDLIRARAKESIRVAASQLRGGLSKRIKEIRDKLLSSLALIEANIDFPDDVKEPNQERLEFFFTNTLGAIDSLLSSASTGKILREGIATVILGKPNVGKSSLLNALLREERAIVTEIPGTTRDLIEEGLSVKGLPLRIVDTAGLRKASGKIEKLGQEKTKEALARAELALCVIDASEKLEGDDRKALKDCLGKKTLVILNKIDLGQKVSEEEIKMILPEAPRAKTSALYGEGIPELEEMIAKLVASDKIVAGNETIVSNARHKECLMRSRESLKKALESMETGLPGDFVAIDLKGAIVALGEVTGETVTDEVLEKIFEEFCVGK